MKLQTIFYQLFQEIGFIDSQIQDLWLEWLQTHSHPKRHYHNTHHISYMMYLYQQHEQEIEQSIEMKLAIFYHDYIYKTYSKNNERESAKFLLNLISRSNVPDKQTIYNLILVTKNHTPKTLDEEKIMDFDLAILGASPPNYFQYKEKIRQEYQFYPDFIFNHNRKKVLQYFLNMPKIFNTPYFYEYYEKQARSNIFKELEMLY